MPKILIVAATPIEIAPILDEFKVFQSDREGLLCGERNISVLITGVGMVNTAYHLGRHSNGDFDHVINAGICGAFNNKFKIGEVVHVTSDTLAELGAEDDTEFITFKDLNLGGTAVYYGRSEAKSPILNTLKQVKGITVNKVHGNEKNIKRTVSLFDPDIETMEGAAFFRACEHLKGSYVQIRAVSNLVEKRDKSKWNIPLAINNLNAFLFQLINSLNA